MDTESDLITADRDVLIAIIAQLQATVLEQQRVIERLERRIPDRGLELVNLPRYSPDFNADEAIWGWVREEATGNLCLGTGALVQERINNFLAGLASWKGAVKRRCRSILLTRAEALMRDSQPNSQRPANGHPTLALV